MSVGWGCGRNAKWKQLMWANVKLGSKWFGFLMISSLFKAVRSQALDVSTLCRVRHLCGGCGAHPCQWAGENGVIAWTSWLVGTGRSNMVCKSRAICWCFIIGKSLSGAQLLSRVWLFVFENYSHGFNQPTEVPLKICLWTLGERQGIKLWILQPLVIIVVTVNYSCCLRHVERLVTKGTFWVICLRPIKYLCPKSRSCYLYNMFGKVSDAFKDLTSHSGREF